MKQKLQYVGFVLLGLLCLGCVVAFVGEVHTQTLLQRLGGLILFLLFAYFWSLYSHEKELNDESRYQIFRFNRSDSVCVEFRNFCSDFQLSESDSYAFVKSAISNSIYESYCEHEEKVKFAQQRVDSFYSEIFSNQTNPFTRKPILSESDYHSYLLEKNSTKDEHGQYHIENELYEKLFPDQSISQSRIYFMSKDAYAQYRVDKVCELLFQGQLNPFTQKPISSEADFRAYQREREKSIMR